MNPYPAAWAALTAVGVALEVSALLRKREPSTLSANVWWLLGRADRRHRYLGYAARGAVVAGLTLLGVHFAFRWPQ